MSKKCMQRIIPKFQQDSTKIKTIDALDFSQWFCIGQEVLKLGKDKTLHLG